MQTRFKSDEEWGMLQTLKSELPQLEALPQIDVRYETDIMGRFAIYVILDLGSRFTFELREELRRKVRRVVQTHQPAAELYIRFV